VIGDAPHPRVDDQRIPGRLAAFRDPDQFINVLSSGGGNRAFLTFDRLLSAPALRHVKQTRELTLPMPILPL